MVQQQEMIVPTFKHKGWASDKKYYDDKRDNTILKLNSVDNRGVVRYKSKQNIFDNYVYDLQTDLRKMDFLEVGEPDGYFGEKTKFAVENFQLASKYQERVVNEIPKVVSITFKDKMDGVVGNKTKAEIKIWLVNNYINPFEIHHRVPLIPQKYTWSCWAACFQMLLTYNKINWTQEEICDNAGLQRSILTSGITLEDILDAAENLGLGLIEHPKASLQVSEWVKLLKEKGPVVITWGPQHMRVFKGITRDPQDPWVFMNDPAPKDIGTEEAELLSDFHTGLIGLEWMLLYFKAPVSRELTGLDLEVAQRALALEEMELASASFQKLK